MSNIEIYNFIDKHITPYGGEFDKNESLPLSLIKKIGKEGLLVPTLPKVFGGKDMDMLEAGFLYSYMGGACSSARGLLTVQEMVAHSILRWGTEEQKKYWLPKLSSGEKVAAFATTELNIGSDISNIESTCSKVEEGYVLNGTKKWITFGQIADVFLVFAKYNGQLSAFLVESNTSGLSTQKVENMMGMRAGLHAEVLMENCVISSENILGPIGMGTHISSYALDFGRFSVAWGCIGIGQRCYTEAIKYCKSREQFGVPLREHQLIQGKIADMLVKLESAKLLCIKAGELKRNSNPESVKATWVAKYSASRMATFVANEAVQIHGALGCSGEHFLERFYRDAKIMEIIEGTNEIQQIVISQYEFQGS